ARVAVGARKSAIDKLDALASSYDEIDWESMVSTIVAFEQRKRQLEESSGELARIGREIDRVEVGIETSEHERRGIDQEIGRLCEDQKRAQTGVAEAARIGAEPEAVAAQRHYDALAARVVDVPATAEHCAAEELRHFKAVNDEAEAVSAKAEQLARRI